MTHDGRQSGESDGTPAFATDPHLICRVVGGQKSGVVTIDSDRGDELLAEYLAPAVAGALGL